MSTKLCCSPTPRPTPNRPKLSRSVPDRTGPDRPTCAFVCDPAWIGPLADVCVCVPAAPSFQVDEEFARQCLEQQTAHLRGPPNRPTAGSLTCEQEGLLRAALEFLAEQARGAGGGGGSSSDGGGRQVVERSSDRSRAGGGDGVSRGQEAAGAEGGASGDDAGSSESGA